VEKPFKLSHEFPPSIGHCTELMRPEVLHSFQQLNCQASIARSQEHSGLGFFPDFHDFTTGIVTAMGASPMGHFGLMTIGAFRSGTGGQKVMGTPFIPA
jgi:hypothetical protein